MAWCGRGYNYGHPRTWQKGGEVGVSGRAVGGRTMNGETARCGGGRESAKGVAIRRERIGQKGSEGETEIVRYLELLAYGRGVL